ncbi:hypothetical protein Z043_105707 [Scleropages formosus]|uniref:Uncharacterized protein n=1 Tax=Scleropages formosus TaxID=113540 RepID=A0A0P7UY16_SCLFO|nr:hypothetical protein Z043_105707 [Scleropages formosus]
MQGSWQEISVAEPVIQGLVLPLPSRSASRCLSEAPGVPGETLIARVPSFLLGPISDGVSSVPPVTPERATLEQNTRPAKKGNLQSRCLSAVVLQMTNQPGIEKYADEHLVQPSGAERDTSSTATISVPPPNLHCPPTVWRGERGAYGGGRVVAPSP